MQVQDYCKAMLAEVSAWKARLEAMKKTADGFGSEQKEKVLPLIGQLEQEVVNAQLRVDQLENECPSDWSPIKNELDDLFWYDWEQCRFCLARSVSWRSWRIAATRGRDSCLPRSCELNCVNGLSLISSNS
ncbi:MAG: hypothetical protein PVG44_02545 [Desulfobacterales bacterium]